MNEDNSNENEIVDDLEVPEEVDAPELIVANESYSPPKTGETLKGD